MSIQSPITLPVIKPNKLQKFLSYLFPIRIFKTKGEGYKPLRVVVYKGQTQLAYGNVYYSDGVDYFPFRKAFMQIGNAVLHFQHLLVLGSGIGSVAMVLDDLFPNNKKKYTFVDIDSTILALCKSHLSQYDAVIGKYVLQDATVFIQRTAESYDCICVDVFNEHLVPKPILQETFIQHVFDRLNMGGYVILNLMFQSNIQQMGFEQILERLDKDYQSIHTRNNIIFIAKKHK